jgi:hypothetical protein
MSLFSDAIYDFFEKFRSQPEPLYVEYTATYPQKTWSVSVETPRKRPHYYCSRSGRRWK